LADLFIFFREDSLALFYILHEEMLGTHEALWLGCIEMICYIGHGMQSILPLLDLNGCFRLFLTL